MSSSPRSGDNYNRTVQQTSRYSNDSTRPHRCVECRRRPGLETTTTAQHSRQVATVMVARGRIAAVRCEMTQCSEVSNVVVAQVWRQLRRSHHTKKICGHNCVVERRLVVDFCGQPHYCYRPYYPTARFRSPSSHMVSDEPFPDRSRPMSC